MKLKHNYLVVAIYSIAFILIGQNFGRWDQVNFLSNGWVEHCLPSSLHVHKLED